MAPEHDREAQEQNTYSNFSIPHAIFLSQESILPGTLQSSPQVTQAKFYRTPRFLKAGIQEPGTQ
jgi:hypothetical protein